MADRPNAEEVRKRLEEKQNALIRLLKCPDGKAAIEFLEAKYGRDVVEADPYKTHVRIGERRVVDYLKELRGLENV